MLCSKVAHGVLVGGTDDGLGREVHDRVDRLVPEHTVHRPAVADVAVEPLHDIAVVQHGAVRPLDVQAGDPRPRARQLP